jgi:cyclase
MKKRLVFTFLFSNGKFCLSRNFRLQAVGDFEWLLRNCNLESMLFALDEVCIVDCSRNSTSDKREFLRCVEKLNTLSFAPVTVGGWIRKISDAALAFGSGADKIIVNTPIFEQSDLIEELVQTYGSQAVVASLDVNAEMNCLKRQGHESTGLTLSESIDLAESLGAGELLINSIPRDGTGSGLDLKLIQHVLKQAKQPTIFTGGIGQPAHFFDGYVQAGAMSLATSNLLNFVGDSILMTREYLYREGIDLPIWSTQRGYR